MERTSRRFEGLARSALVLAVALLVAAGVAEQAMAKPIRTQASIAVRVAAQRDTCELLGGGELTVTKFPQKDRPKENWTTRTECKGGTEGGTICTNTPKMTNCYQAVTRPPDDGRPGVPIPDETLQGNGAGGRSSQRGGAGPGGGRG